MTQDAWALQKISGLDAPFFLEWKRRLIVALPEVTPSSCIVTKCATCPLTSGCGGNPNAEGRCLRGDDLAEIAALTFRVAELEAALERAQKIGLKMNWHRTDTA